MQKFKEFVNEKLTLDHISKMNPKGNWVDAKDLTFNDIHEGDIIETGGHTKYVVITEELAKQFISMLNTQSKYTFIRKDQSNTTFGYSYLTYSAYKYTFPVNSFNSDSDFNIIRIYRQKKKLRTKQDLIDYMEKNKDILNSAKK